MWGLKSIIKIMKNGFEWRHPSSRNDQDAGFSVPWITVFLSRGGIKGREHENYTMPTKISGTFFFLSSPSYKEHLWITSKPHSSLLPIFQTKKWTFLKFCRLLWVLLLHCRSSFLGTGHSSVPVDVPSPCPALPWVLSPEQLPPRLLYQQPPALPSAPLPKLC